MDKLLTTDRAAEYLGIAVTTLRQHCQEGHIGTKVGRQWLFTIEALDEFKKTRRKPGRPRKEETTKTAE